MALFKKKIQEEINDQPIESHQSDSPSAPEENETVRTALTFHADWELSNQEKYVYMFKHQQLPPLLKNQISIKGINLVNFDGGFVVVAFLRNTLAKAIRFEIIDLIVLDENGQAMAKKQFELDSLGEIPPNSSMPWRFLFSNEDKLVGTIPEENWSIAFELKQSSKKPQQLDLAESWQQQLSPIQIKELEDIVASLPLLSADEVNFHGLDAKITAEENLAVTVLIRNGSNKQIQFEHIPLLVEDATGEVICRGGFQMDDFKIKPNSSKPWTFIFPKELLTKTYPDLSAWKIYPPQHEVQSAE